MHINMFLNFYDKSQPGIRIPMSMGTLKEDHDKSTDDYK
jgi:hypothetical protein